ncbi:MAG: hypothetical protein U5L45_07890 [Saprospiraceae bacterium]|nr:hypothetical protein [Saprospiraceae bacterium]
MTRLFILFFLLLSTTASVSAQVEKPYFQVFDISEDVKSIKIETADSFKVRKWNGVQLMVDMSIRLEGGTMDLLSVVIFDNRYAYESANQGSLLLIRPKMTHRENAKIKYMGTVCAEKIVMTVYIPDGFEMRSPTEFVKKEDVIIAAEKN